MMSQLVLERLGEDAAVSACAADLASADVQFAVSDRLRPALAVALSRLLGRPVLVVTGGVGEAEEFAAEASNYIEPERVLQFRAHETFPWEHEQADAQGAGLRLRALAALESGGDVVVVAPISALMRKVAPRSDDVTSPLVVHTGEQIDFDETIRALVDMDYERAHLVEVPGQFAVRGGILDVFPSTSQYPVRIELFGEEVESIRRFLVSSQQSVTPEREVTMYGCRDARLEQEPAAGEDFRTIGDYLPSETVVVLDEPRKIRDEAVRHMDRVAAAGGSFDASRYFVRAEELMARLGRCRRLDLFALAEATAQPGGYALECRAVEPALGRADRIVSVVRKLSAAGTAVVACVRDEGHGRRLREILSEAGVAVPSGGSPPGPGLVAVEVADIARGYVIPKLHLAVLAHGDLFPRPGRTRADRQTSVAEAGRLLAGLRRGDYVVHASHGVAIYGGIESKEMYGCVRDYVVLEYADRDRLYVPVEQMGRISRYVAGDGGKPRITRLSSNDWARATRKARDSAKKLAVDLVKLYAQRATISGHAFAADTVWQAELEDAFPFEETPDQLAAIAAVKSDMEQPKPMDRLVCGDVGYGKTEVAIRAAAKAVLDDRQVIVLAPTTILAQQHYATFCERFAPFPVRVEMLSRFRSHAQQRRILADFAIGRVDILIGTHRLLQKDVVPKDLGLVVVDEEQRFGVGHKEHLKDMRKAVDVLTLTATPIPRTLQMSLVGVRDMSVIDTPPDDRFEVATHVGAYDPGRVREAVAREMDRDGQVFYVFNRVQGIDLVAEKVRELAGDTRVGVAHGQMHERELERTMSAFLAREIDVLVCTTIIESGIDIPTVNTLIVEGAERLGLGQLYQLRGRVGRSHHRAYAYFMFSDAELLTHAAVERLQTIREFTYLGSGTKIAMRDLEIRGAGNILGPEQHGHMAAVGFELYCRMLRDAVADVRGEPVERWPQARIALPIDAYLPVSYIAEEGERVEAYRQVAEAATSDEIKRVGRELADRFGPPSTPVRNLLDVAELRVLATEAGLAEIAMQDESLRVDFVHDIREMAETLATRRGWTVFGGEDRLLVPAGPESSPLTMAFELASDIMAVVDLQGE